MKRYIKTLISIAILSGTMASCQTEDLPLSGINAVPEGYRAVEFMAEVPRMNEVQTKAVDPDGGGVQNMTIFCFDVNSLFITTVTAEILSGKGGLEGTFKANVPDHTVTMHFIGNQNLTYFKEDSYRGRSEVDVMHDLEASAGRMIYWNRESIDNMDQYKTSPLQLIRNQAKFTLEVADGVRFTPSGWVVVNTNAFGTVAPYCAEHGFEAPHYLDRPFVSMPENQTKLGDFLDVRNNPEEYVFETENTADDPIDFIVKGRNGTGTEEMYYRISIIDNQGDYIPVYRNHHYEVKIQGELMYGQQTFEEALAAPATNNVLVSVSDDIKQIGDGVNTLSVKDTYVVIPEKQISQQGTYYYLYYECSSTSPTPPEPEVSWLDGNNVAMHNFSHDPESGTIGINLYPLGQKQIREGTLLIKYGRLTRKIKVITIKEQKFEPAWITTNIHGVEAGEQVTMMFTVPEECPEELFPMEVLVTVNDMDIRNESGMKLPVITQADDPERYGEPNGVGYKYVLTVDAPGKQRLYLETILRHSTTTDEFGNEIEPTVQVTIEADHFVSLTKTATLHDDEIGARILLHNLSSYVAELPADEVIYYYLVPQKINAPVELVIHLGVVYDKKAEADAEGYDEIVTDQLGTHYVKFVEPGNNDEFLFYSRYLDHNKDVDFTFHPIHEDEWSTGGRVHGFTRNAGAGTLGDAVFHLVTNTPKSAEVVRIASNPKGEVSVTGSGKCNGNQYRSAIFELANYHPFHFEAKLNGVGTITSGENEEVIDNVLITYRPGEPVYLDFDLKSFRSQKVGIDGNVLPDDKQEDVDPFGTAFDVYIDAPMFELDMNQDLVKQGKLEADSGTAGRFIYHVDKDKDVESGFEKRVKFIPKNIVSSGEVKISADDSVVIFYEKTFRVNNSSITGRIMYDDGTGFRSVPANSFIPLEMLPTYNRIGTVAVNADGNFEIRLRSEYKYDWNLDNVKFQFTDEDGNIYEKEYDSLEDLYTDRNTIVLKKIS